MTSKLLPEANGVPLPPGVIVLRLAKPTMDGKAQETHFTLSSEDKESVLKSLTVWAKDITTAEIARNLMGANRGAYEWALYLNVNDIRSININLDVVWDEDLRKGAEGHCGIVGLKHPNVDKHTYKKIRMRLAEIVNSNPGNIQILPIIHNDG